MDYSVSENLGVISVQLTGELTLTDEEKFRGLSQEVTEMNGEKCVVNLNGLEFLDSAGLGLLLVMKELCGESGKSMSLKVDDCPVREILEISEFDSLIPYEAA